MFVGFVTVRKNISNSVWVSCEDKGSWASRWSGMDRRYIDRAASAPTSILRVFNVTQHRGNMYIHRCG